VVEFCVRGHCSTRGLAVAWFVLLCIRLSKEESSSIIDYRLLRIIDVIDVARFISIIIISLILLFYVAAHVCTNSL